MHVTALRQVRLALDKDFRAQVGKDRFFDLVDYERLPPEQSFRCVAGTQAEARLLR